MLQKRRPKFQKTISLALKAAGALSLLVLFQNCGGGFREIESGSLLGSATGSSVGPVMESNDLGYPYFAKPEFMAELSVLSMKPIDAETKEISIEGVIVNLDSPETGVTYEIFIENTSGQQICSTRKGLTESAMRAFQYLCIATNVTDKVTAKIFAQSAEQNKLVSVRVIEFVGLL